MSGDECSSGRAAAESSEDGANAKRAASFCRKRAKTNGDTPSNGAPSHSSFRELVNKLDTQQKSALLWELLISSDATALDFASSAVDELQRKRSAARRQDPLAALPTPVALKILRMVDPKSLCHCMRVSRAWRTLCVEPCLWKALCSCERSFRMCSKLAERRQLARHTSASGTVRWRDAFEERFRLWKSWHAGRCVVRTFHGHTQDVTCVQFDSERIVSGGSDRTIRMWRIDGDTTTDASSVVLRGHSDTVRCIFLDGSRLASGSNDFSIKLWDLAVNRSRSSIASRQTLVGHTSSVRCLKLYDEKLISGSYDQLLKIWSVETGRCRTTLFGHTGAVLCLYADDEVLLSGSADFSIKCWDERNANVIMTLHNAHDNPVTCLRVDGARIVSASTDRTVRIWDLRTGRCLQTTDWKLAEDNSTVTERFMQFDAWRVVSAGDDRSIKVRNLNTGERLCTLQSHSEVVTCVHFNDYQVVSGSFDKTVKLWDFGVC